MTLAELEKNVQIEGQIERIIQVLINNNYIQSKCVSEKNQWLRAYDMAFMNSEVVAIDLDKKEIILIEYQDAGNYKRTDFLDKLDNIGVTVRLEDE